LSTVNGADVRAVLYGIIETLPEFLSEGNSVQLGDLGYFRVSISSSGEENEEDVNANSIRRSKILFRPGTKIAEMLNNLSFKKA
jgi:predicted histone-like DNA-binding protein